MEVTVRTDECLADSAYEASQLAQAAGALLVRKVEPVRPGLFLVTYDARR